MKSRIWLALAFVALAAPSSSLGADDGTAPKELAEAIRFRAELGLDATPSEVARIIESGQTLPQGLPLLPAEHKELLRRAQMEERLTPAMNFVESRSLSFGGVFFDQSVGDLLFVVRVLANTPPEEIAELRALLPAGARVEYRAADYSQADLEAVKDLLASRFVPGAVEELYVDPVTNRVVASVRDGAEEDVLSEAGAMAPAVTIQHSGPLQPAACTSRLACDLPWRGGIRLTGDLNCTWGFNGRPTSGATTKFVISAGHCSRLNRNLSHNGVVVNVAPGVDRNTFDMIGSRWTDALSAPLKGDVNPRNVIYLTASSTYAITGVRANVNQGVGNSVCMSGVGSGYRCGSVEAKGITANLTRSADGKSQTFTALTRVSFTATGGDSGGSVVHSTMAQAYGVVAAIRVSDSKMYYGPMDLALDELALRLCLDSSCN